MADMRARLQGAKNNSWMTSAIYPTIGVIDTINTNNNSATVRSTKGVIENARLPLPYYSTGTGIFYTPVKGDCCMVSYESSGKPFITAFYPLRPVDESSGVNRLYPPEHTLKIKTKAGDVINMSDSEDDASISIKSPKEVGVRVRDESDADNVTTVGTMLLTDDSNATTYSISVGRTTVGAINVTHNEEDKTTTLFLQVGNHTLTMEDIDGTGSFNLTIGDSTVIIDSGDIKLDAGTNNVEVSGASINLNSTGLGGNVVTMPALRRILTQGSLSGDVAKTNFLAAISAAEQEVNSAPAVNI